MRKRVILGCGVGGGAVLLATVLRKQRPRITHTSQPDQLLSLVAQIPVYRWSYRWSHVAHIGPLAQEFYAALGVGASSRTINLLDVCGVLLACVQALSAQVQELQRRGEEQGGQRTEQGGHL